MRLIFYDQGIVTMEIIHKSKYIFKVKGISNDICLIILHKIACY